MRPEPCKVQGSPALNVVQGGLRIEKEDKKIRNQQLEITEPMLFPRNGLLSRLEPCFSPKRIKSEGQKFFFLTGVSGGG